MREPKTVPLSSLRPGNGFVMALTGRLGIILDIGHWGEIAVLLDDPREEKLLHRDVRVFPQRRVA